MLDSADCIRSSRRSARSHARRAALLGCSILAAIAPISPVAAQSLVNSNTTIGGTIDGGNAAGYFVTNGATLNVNNGTLKNFTTTGGSGSGGGAGFGGAIFIDNGSAAILNGVNLSHDTAIGGVGGTISSTGGVLNNGVVNGYFSPTGNGTSGTTPPAAQENQYIFGDGSGNGLNGGTGGSGTNATQGVGGAGAQAQYGTPGWSSNPVAAANVNASQQALTSANTGLTSAQTALGAATADVAAWIALAAAAAAGFNAGGPTTQIEVPGFIAGGAAAATAEAAAALALTGAQQGVTAAQSALDIANAQLSAWNAAANNGTLANGGNGGDGGKGGSGSYGFGGGAGGNGVVGAAAGTAGASEGNSGNGGQGGAGGFGGGGGAGGFGAGASGDANAGFAGVGGAGGTAGFGGGVGSIGGVIGNQLASGCGGVENPYCLSAAQGAAGTAAYGGGGGDGYGGAIFVNTTGALTLTGTGTFSGNNAIGGASLNGGAAGGAAGTDLFMMTGATVNIAPGAGNVVTFNGSIADDSIASIGTPSFPLGATPPVGAGAGLTIYSGLTVFNGQNTYSGETVINGGALGGPLNTGVNATGAPDYATTDGALQAASGVGLPSTSNLKFAGPAQFTGGVLQTSGTFTRWVNPNPNPYGNGNPSYVQWTGSGGFAANNAPLTVTLSGNAPLTWGSDGFVPFGSSLMFGSANSNNAVTFTNAIDITGGLLSAGTAASIVVANNGNTAGSTATMSGVISGAGDLSIGGGGFNGTLYLTGANTYTGATQINSGTLALSSNGSIPGSPLIDNGIFDISQTTAGGAVASLAGSGTVALGQRMLIITAGSTTFSGTIADGGIGGGTGGMLTISGGTQTLSGTNTYTGATMIQGGATLALSGLGSIANSAAVSANGTLDISQTTSGASITTLSGSGAVVLGSQFLALTAAAAGSSGTGTAGIFSGVISGLGGLAIAGGTEKLTGTNTYTGGTVLFPNAQLLTNATTALVAGSPILLVSSGGGVTDLFTGSMHVDGPLNILDSQPSATLTLGVGDTLKGVGAVNATVVNTGGTIAPGDGPGTLVINAPVSYGAASTYQVTIDGPTSSVGCVNPAGCAGTYSSIIVTGAGNTFTAGGTIAPQLRGIGAPANNNYTPPATTRFTVAQASGGVLGSFATLTQPASGLAPGTRFDAIYTANAIDLYVTPANYQNLTPWNVGLGKNESQVAGAINALRGAAGPRNNASATADLSALYQVQPQALPAAFDTLSGEATTGIQRSGFEMMGQFLDVMIDPTANGRGGDADTRALGYASADPAQMPTKASSIFDPILAQARATFGERWQGWAAGFGGYNQTDGSAADGTHNLTAYDYGIANGYDYHFDDGSVAGFALAGGGSNWSVAQNLGSGRSDAFQAGIYAKTNMGPAYLAAAAAFANHWTSVNRTTFAGDQVSSAFNAQTYGLRLEGGYRFALPAPGVTLSPYAAVQAQALYTPSFSETDPTGAFGLNYEANTATDVRSELGARFAAVQRLDNGIPFTVRGRAAWAHDWVRDTALTATFQAGLLPGAMPGAGASFTVDGAQPSADSALVSAGAELRLTSWLSVGADFDGNFSSGAQTYAGKAKMRVTW